MFKKSTRSIAALLCLIFIFGCFPVNSLASFIDKISSSETFVTQTDTELTEDNMSSSAKPRTIEEIEALGAISRSEDGSITKINTAKYHITDRAIIYEISTIANKP